MKKSMYSLILMEDVVNEIDRIAASENTNRSNLINQILADYVSLITPEKKVNSIFKYIENIIGTNDDFTLFIEPNDMTMSLKSSLEYRYRPTIKYEVELYRTNENIIGELKVIFRTQSQELLMELTHYFKIWINLEELYIMKFFPDKAIQYEIDEGKFVRSFCIPKGKEYSDEEIGKAISNYITMFDDIMKGYLSSDFTDLKDIENKYLNYLNSGAEII